MDRPREINRLTVGQLLLKEALLAILTIESFE